MRDHPWFESVRCEAKRQALEDGRPCDGFLGTPDEEARTEAAFNRTIEARTRIPPMLACSTAIDLSFEYDKLQQVASHTLSASQNCEFSGS